MKHLLLKTWVVMLCLLAGVGSAWAENYATWTFASGTAGTNYPSNNTAFTATSGSCGESTFTMNGSGSQWNSTKGYAFTAITDMTVTLKLTGNLAAGSSVTFAADMYYNKASNAPMTGFNLTVSENSGSYVTTGLSATSISLSTSSANKSVTYTTQTALTTGQTIVLKYTQTGKAGAGQGYVGNITVDGPAITSGGGDPTPTVTAPTFSVAAGTYTEDQTVKVSNYNSDYLYAYTLDGTVPAFDENLDVTNGTAYDNSEGIKISSSCTLKAIAIDEEGNTSSIASATYTINKPIVFTSLEELAAADLTSGTNVTVSFENVPIKSFQTVSGTRRGVYFDIQKGGNDIEIYFNSAIPAEWVEGGTLSGTMTNCPWKLYSSTWELAPASGWAWTNLTYKAPAQKTITALEISGTPTKTAYYVGDAFDPAGLVVTATYSDSHQEVITEGIDWTIDPETLTLGTTSVDVQAGVGSVVSEVYTVEGLTVTENPFKTATISSFEATSGDINTDIAYEAFKGNSTSDPFVNGSLRLYQNGGYVTVTAVAGLKINRVKITTSGTYASTTVGYCVDDEDAPTTGETVAKNSSYTISNLNNKSVSIYCLGTDKNTRLEISAIEVTYSGTPVAELKNIALSGTYPTEFNKGDEFSHEGMIVTANYTDGSNANVTSSATFSGYDMNVLGEQTVTVSYTEDEITKTAEYSITVNKAPFIPTPAANGYETVNFAVLYSSVTTSATVEDYEGTSCAMAFAKPQSSSTPTKYYDNGKAVRAYEGNTITITAVEAIKYVDIAWVSGYVDDAVSVTGLGTTTAVVTFSKTCRFTSITVGYGKYVRNVNVGDYGTICLHCAVTAPEGATFYSVSGISATDEITLGQVSSLEAGKPYIFKATADAIICEYTGDAVAEPVADTYLTGVFVATPAPADSYVLQNQSGVVGFYQVGSTIPTVGAYRAYLTVPGSNARVLTFGDETAISNIKVENNSNNVIYNMAGQRVNKAEKGIFIINGKKVIK